jgi:hypothetical protein
LIDNYAKEISTIKKTDENIKIISLFDDKEDSDPKNTKLKYL